MQATYKISGLSTKTSLIQSYNNFLTGNPTNPYLISYYYSSTNNLYNVQIRFDSSGNKYVLGYYVDPGIILAKYNSVGDLQWAKKLSSTNTGSYNLNFAVSSGGNSYITCADAGTNSRINIIKVDNTGSIIWQKYYDSADYDEQPFIQLDSSENIWLGCDNTTGYYNYTTAKINSSGALQTAQTIKDSNINFAAGIGLDSSANFYNIVRWSTTGSVYDIVLHKFSSGFAIQWTRKFATGVNINSTNSYTDSSGNTYLAVSYNSAPYYTTHLIKYDSSGNLSWQRKISESVNILNASAVVADSSGNVYVVTNGTYPSYLLKYNSSGTLQWQRYITNLSTRYINIDSNGYLHLVGACTINSRNSAFELVYPSDGGKTGTFTNNVLSFDIGTSTLTDASGIGTSSTPASFQLGTGSPTVTTPSVWSISTLSDTSSRIAI